MQKYIRPFEIHNQNTQNLAVTASNQTLTITPGIGNRSIRILVTGTQNVFFSYGATAALATSTPLLANTVETFFLASDTTQISFIAAATGSTIYITLGEGA